MVLSASNEAFGIVLEEKTKSPARIVDGAQYSKPKPTSQVGSAFLFAARCVLYYNTYLAKGRRAAPCWIPPAAGAGQALSLPAPLKRSPFHRAWGAGLRAPPQDPALVNVFAVESRPWTYAALDPASWAFVPLNPRPKRSASGHLTKG